MKYLLETDHISVLQQQSGPAYLALASRIAIHARADLAVSIVSFHEQALGCHAYINRARTAAESVRGYRMLSRLLSDFATASVLPFDDAAAAVFDGLQARKLRIGRMDLRIASIALARGLTLVTRNARDFRTVPRPANRGLDNLRWRVAVSLSSIGDPRAADRCFEALT